MVCIESLLNSSLWSLRIDFILVLLTVNFHIWSNLGLEAATFLKTFLCFQITKITHACYNKRNNGTTQRYSCPLPLPNNTLTTYCVSFRHLPFLYTYISFAYILHTYVEVFVTVLLKMDSYSITSIHFVLANLVESPPAPTHNQVNWHSSHFFNDCMKSPIKLPYTMVEAQTVSWHLISLPFSNRLLILCWTVMCPEKRIHCPALYAV